jgi:predicted phage baseplate assembly protein
VFGDGVHGARVPTGTENVRAAYRTGLGRKGNLDAGQIDQAVGAPLGVKKVTNPLPSQGGADPEPLARLRDHVPLAVTAMDRLVSVEDYANFARSYAGIGRASATRLQGAVHLTIASLDPQPFDMQGPLVRNLRHALELFGDPSQRFELHDRDASLLIIVANVRIEQEREWIKVEPEIRRALLASYSYETAELGQDLLLSAAIATMQAVPGVVYVDVDKFDAVRQEEIAQLAERLTCLTARPRVPVFMARTASDEVELAHLEPRCRDNIINSRAKTIQGYDPSAVRFHPAELCFLSPEIRDTLILEQLP